MCGNKMTRCELLAAEGGIDAADLPEIYRLLQEAEVRGEVTEANRLESILQEWVDAHTDEEIEEAI